MMVKLSGQGFADLQDLHTSHRIFIDLPLRVSGSISMSYISVLQATKLPEPRPLLLDLTASQEEPRSTQTLSVSQLCFHGSATPSTNETAILYLRECAVERLITSRLRRDIEALDFGAVQQYRYLSRC
jgi:hypothetical protein